MKVITDNPEWPSGAVRIDIEGEDVMYLCMALRHVDTRALGNDEAEEFIGKLLAELMK